MFGKIFKSAKKVANQNTLEAIVAGCLLVACADGNASRGEIEKMERLLTSNENLSAFKPAEIRKLSQKYQNLLEADFLVGQKKMLDEISDISDNSDTCEEVFLNMLAIANADGKVEPPETTVLLKVARLLGVDASEYGLT